MRLHRYDRFHCQYGSWDVLKQRSGTVSTLKSMLFSREHDVSSHGRGSKQLTQDCWLEHMTEDG